MRVGDVIELRAERLDGRGVASAIHEGMPLCAGDWLPGELAALRVAHVGRHRAHGHVVSILEPSSARRSAPCARRALCGGCPLMHADESFVTATKRDDLAALGLPVDRVVGDGRPLGYRWSSKRVVGGTPGALVVGSYRAGTHVVAPMDGCLVDHPDIAACFDELSAVGSRLAVIPFDDATQTGDLRYAWAKTDGRGNVLLTLVTGSTASDVRALAAALSRPAGIAWCVQGAAGNAMRGEQVVSLRGVETLHVELAGFGVDVGPLGFLQPNPSVAAMAYEDLVAGCPGHAPPHPGLALDLYAGAGITSRMLQQRFETVRSCDAYPESAAALGVAPQTAESFLAALDRAPHLVVANPPRAGLGPAVCDALLALPLPPERSTFLHVMSCEPRGLARDIAQLTATGAFALLGARAYDTLPQTAHVEVVAWLVRRDFRPPS